MCTKCKAQPDLLEGQNIAVSIPELFAQAVERERGKVISFEMPINGISSEACNEILNYLYGVFGYHIVAQAPMLPYSVQREIREMEWVWLNKRGTLPKRLSSLLHKAGFSLPAWAMAQVGIIARKHTAKHSTYHFKLTNRFDWERGEFGDDDSCMFNPSDYPQRSWARINFALAGGYAIQAFSDAEGTKGQARAWVFPHKATNSLVLFGAYANDYDLFGPWTLTRLLASYLGVTYGSRIECVNHSDSSGDLYIGRNSTGDHGKGWLIGQAADIAQVELVDLEVDTYEGAYGTTKYKQWMRDVIDELEKETLECDRCGDSFGEDENWSPVDGERWCEHCADHYGNYCDHCHDYFSAGLITVETSRGEQEWCVDCVENNASHCSGCDTCHAGNEVECEECSDSFCSDCISEHPETGRQLCGSCALCEEVPEVVEEVEL